jgi:hypothetical protein
MDVTQLIQVLKDEHPDIVLMNLETGEKFLVLSHSIDEVEMEEE